MEEVEEKSEFVEEYKGYSIMCDYDSYDYYDNVEKKIILKKRNKTYKGISKSFICYKPIIFYVIISIIFTLLVAYFLFLFLTELNDSTVAEYNAYVYLILFCTFAVYISKELSRDYVYGESLNEVKARIDFKNRKK